MAGEVVHDKLLLTWIGFAQQKHPPIHKTQALTKNVSACVHFTGVRLHVCRYFITPAVFVSM